MSRKALYRKRRKQKRCGSCGKQDERTLSGFSQCEKCYNKTRDYTKRNIDAHNAATSLWMYRRYYNRQEKHCCPRCGEKLPDDYYYIYCENCREKERLRKAKKKTVKHCNA